MKNTKGVKLLLAVIAILAVQALLWGIYNLWQFKILPLKDNYIYIKTAYDNMSKDLTYKGIYEESKYELINETHNLNVETNLVQEEIIMFINEYCIKNNIEISNVNFSEKVRVSLNEEENENMVHASVSNVDLEIKCKHDDMLKLIDDIKNDSKPITISNMRTMEWSDEVIYCVVSLNFYSLENV